MRKMLSVLASLMLPVSAAYAENHTIHIRNHAFMPAVLTISAGTTVTWTNSDQDPHTIYEHATPVRFHSAALDTNDSYSYTFTTPGTYSYFCTMHPVMMGKIIVTATKANADTLPAK